MVKNVRDHSIFLTDPDGIITSWNVAAERIIGFSEAEVVGKPFALIFTPEDVAAGVPGKELRQAKEHGRAEDERWHRRKDGSLFWALGIVTPLHDPQGGLSGFSKILRDMTAWKRADEELAASRARLQALFDTTQDAILLADDRARYVDANPAACALLGYNREKLLRLGVFDITPPPDADAGRAAWAAFVRDGRQSGEFPLRRRDGSASLVEYRAVANVQPGLHLSALRDVTARRQSEEALRASEQKFRTLATHAPVGIFQTDPAGNCVFVNDRWCRIAGLSPAAAAGEGWVRALHPDDRDRVRDGWYAAAAGREFATEYRFLAPDGRTTWVRGHAVALRDGGGAVTGHLGTVADITEQRRAAEALRASEARLAAVFDTLPVGVGVADADGNLVLSNRAMHRYLPTGVLPSRDDDRHRRWVARWPDGRPVEPADFPAARALRGERVVPGLEVRYTQDDGTAVWTQTAAVPMRDAADRVAGLVAVVTDIDAPKRAEAAVRSSEARLANAQRIAGVGSWEVDWPTRRVWWSAETYRLVGVDLGAFEPTVEGFLALVPAEDRPAVQRAMADALAGEAAYRVDHRVVRPDGAVRWVSEQAEVEFGPGGGPVRVAGTILDITDRVRAAEDLAASEGRLRALVTASSDVVYSMSPDWSVMRHLAGRQFLPDTHEPTRSWVETYLPADERERVSRAVAEAVRAKGTFELEHRVVRVDGSVGWTFSRAVPILGPGGEVVEWFGAASDITARKEADERLRASEERFRTVFEAMDEGYCVIEMLFDPPGGEPPGRRPVHRHHPS